MTIAQPPTSNFPHKPLANPQATVIYTETDEAPALATYNLLPIFSKFAAIGNVDVVPCDISLSGRVLATFPEAQATRNDVANAGVKVADNLDYLGKLCKTPDPTLSILKLPNISASVPQLEACIKELREKGYNVPLYPHEPKTPEEESIKSKYANVLGSAVNPVIRQGNSDRHTAKIVKLDAQKNPNTSMMKMWSKASRTHVSHMTQGDFYASEKSVVVPKDTNVAIELVTKDGQVHVLKQDLPLLKDEVIDASFMDVAQLCEFYEKEMQDALKTNILLSLHLKATMMKVSDPIMFGHGLKTFFKDAYDKHKATLEKIGANPNLGLRKLYEICDNKLPANEAAAIKADFENCYEKRPWVAMVDSDKGITNWHQPNDIIIDNSMPTVIRDAGCMWNKLGKLEDAKCMIPDRSYATIYQEVISYVKTNGQFDPATMGNVANVGLMAMKAEEYGSHDKTFEIPADGNVRIRDKNSNEIYLDHDVRRGDVWRACQTKDIAIKDWVKLAVDRARVTGSKAIFWLDPHRAHDISILKKVNMYLKQHDITGLDIDIMKPTHAIRESMERATEGLDTISVTGNVLRDYLTDLFPILELGSSAKVLSIVPLIAGGMLYETGAGGSAPKHVQQFLECGHLRWNSLGEYQAFAEAMCTLGHRQSNETLTMLGECLYEAVGAIMEKHEMPERRVGSIDNRDTNFHIALHWAESLAKKEPQNYKQIFEKLQAAEDKVLSEIKASQGPPADCGGYYLFDFDKTMKAMNPSKTLNDILDTIVSSN